MSLKREARFEHEFVEDFEDGECIFEEGDTRTQVLPIMAATFAGQRKLSIVETHLRRKPLDRQMFKRWMKQAQFTYGRRITGNPVLV